MKTKIITLHYEKYLSEIKQELKQYLFGEKYKNILLISDTGSGKTTVLLDLLREENESYVFCVPYTSIVEQLKNKKLNKVKTLCGSDKLVDNKNSLIITYDKSLVIENIDIENRILLQDEVHTKLISSSYRSEALDLVEHYQNKAKKTISITATASELLIGIDTKENNKFIDGVFDYDLIIDCRGSFKEIALEYSLYYDVFKSKKKAFESFINTVLYTRTSNMIDIIRINNKKNLELMKEKLILQGYKVEILQSANKEFSSIYKELVTTGSISKKIDFLLVTSLIDDGLSISGNNYGNLWLFEEARPTIIKQFSARLRDGYNLLGLFCFSLDIQDEIRKSYSDEDIFSLYKKYKTFREAEENFLSGSFILRDLKNKHFIGVKKFNFYRLLDEIHSAKSFYNLKNPERLIETLRKEYDLEFKLKIPLNQNLPLKKSKENCKRNRIKAMKSFRNKLNTFGEVYINLYAYKLKIQYFYRNKNDKWVSENVQNLIFEDMTDLEASIIKEYINLRNRGLDQAIVIAILNKNNKYKNRIIDSISFLCFKDDLNFNNSLEGRVVFEIYNYIKKNEIEKYNKDDAKNIAKHLNNSIPDFPLFDYKTLMSWFSRILSVERLKTGKKRIKIIGEQSYENIARELNVPIMSVKCCKIGNNFFNANSLRRIA